MKRATAHHKRAMDLADQAHLASLKGEHDDALRLRQQAYEAERDAARELSDEYLLEPSRSVLHRSAATMALACGETREAERLVTAALAGTPPDPIAEELRDLLEQVYFRRHLDLRGITLTEDEFQVSITGDSVGFGVAETGVFTKRVAKVETLLYRTAARQLGRPYTDDGRRRKDLKKELELYLTIPRAASFAVTFRVGSKEQLNIPGTSLGTQVVDEVLDCFDLLAEQKMKELEARIDDPTYLQNFVSLAREISPDGSKVKTVGLTVVRDGQERREVGQRHRRERS